MKLKHLLLLSTCITLTACFDEPRTNIQAVRVIDGDTVEIIIAGQDSQRVRLQGIDAPEKRQAFGKKSTETLNDCLAQTPVTLAGEKTDRYGRIVGILYGGDTDCNLNQLQKGMAWHYKAYQKEQPADKQINYAKAEQTAKDQKQGLWADKCPIAPWDFRKKQESCAF